MTSSHFPIDAEFPALLITLAFVVLLYTLISTLYTSCAIYAYHSKATASLNRSSCDGALANGDEERTISLETLLRTQVPSLFHPKASFVPPLWLRS